jgi:hypothetical protein
MNIWIRRLFLLVSVGGGFAGFTSLAALAFSPGLSVTGYFLCAVMTAAFAFGVVAGFVFLTDEEKGLSWLSWYHMVQIPAFSSAIYTYQFSSGLALNLGFGSQGFAWFFWLGGRAQVSMFQLQQDTYEFTLNLFAIWATWYLRRMLKRTRANKQLETAAVPRSEAQELSAGRHPGPVSHS